MEEIIALKSDWEEGLPDNSIKIKQLLPDRVPVGVISPAMGQWQGG
jgi:hypothetical protein